MTNALTIGQRIARDLCEMDAPENNAIEVSPLDVSLRIDAAIAELETQLAATQADNQRLREAAKDVCKANNYTEVSQAVRVLNTLLLTTFDTSALEAIVQKAGEAMRERCAEDVCHNERYLGRLGATQHAQYIRALPGVTLEDLK